MGSQDGSPNDIVWDGNDFWVIGSAGDKAYKYNSSGVYQNVSFSIFANGDSNMQGITWDGNDFWVVGANTDAAYKYVNAIGVGAQGGTEYGNQNYTRIK